MRTKREIRSCSVTEHILGDEGDFLVIASDGVRTFVNLNGKEITGDRVDFDTDGMLIRLFVGDEEENTGDDTTLPFIFKHFI